MFNLLFSNRLHNLIEKFFHLNRYNLSILMNNKKPVLLQVSSKKYKVFQT